MCDYFDDTGYVCPQENLEDNDYCIFHLRDDNKDVDEFNKRIKQLLETEEDLINFHGFYFPPETSDFSRQIFQKKINFYYVIFSGVANFSGATFSKAYFNFATFSREAYFSGAIFSETIFSNAIFSGDAIFSNVTFSGEAYFSGAKFLGESVFSSVSFSRVADFSTVSFSRVADFSNAIFSGESDFGIVAFSEADFSNVTFSGEAYFDNATFSREAYFSGAIFSEKTDFNRATFSGEADFIGATFSREAYFSGAIFSEKTDFDRATFSGEADFIGATFSEKANFIGATFSGEADFEYVEFEGKFVFIPNKSGTIDFENTYFSDNVRIKADMSKCYFANSNIERVDMTDSSWIRDDDKPKNSVLAFIKKVKNKVGLSDTSIVICEEQQGKLSSNWKKLEGIYRRLKQSYQKYGDTSTAGKFYYQEMECKRKQLKGVEKHFWYLFYKKLCGYGEIPFNVIWASLFLIFVSAFLYLFGGIEFVGSSVLKVPPNVIDYNLSLNSFGIQWARSNIDLIYEDFKLCLYTSVITFTTLGYGDVHPIGFSRIVASVEAGFGIIMTALFIFVFTRKMLR